MSTPVLSVGVAVWADTAAAAPAVAGGNDLRVTGRAAALVQRVTGGGTNEFKRVLSSTGRVCVCVCVCARARACVRVQGCV